MNDNSTLTSPTPSTIRENVPPLFQIIMILVSFTIIGSTLYNQLNYVAYHEQQPQLEIVTPQKIAEFGGFPDIVKVGLYIDQFQKFDLIKNEFIFSGIIWFLVLPGIISLETLQKFEFQQSEILYLSPPNVELKDQELLISYNIRVKFTAPLTYIDFPVDDHRINLVFAHQFITPAEILFESSRSSFIVKSEVNSFGWTLNDREVKTGFMSANLDSTDESKNHNFPAVIFSMDFSRFGTRQLISILLPLLLIFYITVFCFSIEPLTSIGLSTGSITAILAYRFVIENLSPKSGYFMLSDYLFFLILSACFATFFFNILDVFLLTIPMNIKKMVLIIIHGFVISVSAYLLLYLS